DSLLMDLAQAEISLRAGAGDAPRLEDYSGRFPRILGRLRSLFQLWQLMAPDTTAAAGPASESVAAPLPGFFGRYRVLCEVGTGAFGRVYKCYDETLHRHVAVKVPHRTHLASPEQVEAFLAEAQALARLNHDGIVHVYDFGRTDSGQCYI